MRIIFFIIFSLIFSFFYSQSKIIGKVIDQEFNETMPFANVLVKGTNIGVTTDFDGNFELSVDSNAVLVFSYLGYITQQVSDLSSSMSVTLEEMFLN